ncbi:hypothetical protein BT96DRAFT_982095 [Gymnopus androsaceus JB14]|uniref:Uncharacterized protein n=1 Tax=Gymnopus androsaceus JB14 TaxID=1447944 RepID=A0A6A4GI04_9AGAR|nr:hypothetical protein BT96DRAFT_982095 [Gymnopus androsaceus JB14]
MASSAQMFAGASNLTFIDSIFTTGNVRYHGAPQATNYDEVLSISNVLLCPPPSQYFVGREGTLTELFKTFSTPVVTIWGTDVDMLRDFVRQNLDYSPIFLDASSCQALDKAYTEMVKYQALPAKLLLVLENADTSLILEDYITTFINVPILVTGTDSAIASFASNADCVFHLPESPDYQVVKNIVHFITKCFTCGQHVITLVANGGSGKTQVVLQFVAKNTSRFSNIWFFDASSEATLTANFKELGKAAGVGEEVKDACNFLARIHENWLCIFDNADDKQLYLKDYIPNCRHGNIIITSRLMEASQMDSPGCHIDFGDLDKEDAIELLLKHAHNENSRSNINLASQIVDALGCHALAVSTAGAYVHTTATCSLANYLARFNRKRREILTYRMGALDQYQRTVFSAFQLSFEQLSQPAQFLMQICASLHPTAIPMEMFTRAAAFTGSDTHLADVDPPTKVITLMREFLSLFEEEDSWDDRYKPDSSIAT